MTPKRRGALSACLAALALGAAGAGCSSEQRDPQPIGTRPAASKPRPSPVTLVPSKVAVTRTVLVQRSWGSGENSFGRDPGDESAGLAPFALAVSPAGLVAVLDVVNERVDFFDSHGRALKSARGPSVTSQGIVWVKSAKAFVAVDARNHVAWKVMPGEARRIRLTNPDFDPVDVEMVYDAQRDEVAGVRYGALNARTSALLHGLEPVAPAVRKATRRTGEPTLAGQIHLFVASAAIHLSIGDGNRKRIDLQVGHDAAVHDIGAPDPHTLVLLAGHLEGERGVFEILVVDVDRLHATSVRVPFEQADGSIHTFAVLGHSVFMLEGDERQGRVVRYTFPA